MTPLHNTTLSKDNTARQALRLIIVSTSADFDKYFNQLMTSDDPEGPHGARIALRRIRSALSGFSPLIDKEVLAAQKDEARRLFRLIGTLRDADVRAESLGSARAQGSPQDELGRIRVALREAMITQRAATYAKRLCSLFATRHWQRKGRKAKNWRKAPVRKIAVRALNRTWSDCRAYGPSVKELSLPDRHSLRKDLKSLRYLAEYFDNLWRGRTKDRFFRRLKSLQEQLGILNDIAMIKETTEPDRNAIKSLEEKTAKALAKSEKAWRLLRKRSLFWT